VVLASGGYPGTYEKGKEISGLERLERDEDVVVFHAGTRRENGRVVTSGGRVLGVTGLGGSIREAIETAYRAVDKVSFEGAFCRRDIGFRAMSREGEEH